MKLPDLWRKAATAARGRLSVSLPPPAWLRHEARLGLRALGKPGVLGLGIAASLLPLYFSAIVPAQERLEAARRSTLALKEQAQHGGNMPNGAQHTQARQLAEFYRVFPQERNSPQWLGKLVALAEKNGLSLNEGEYRAVRDKGGRLMRLQITLPVKGDYSQIRRFLSALPRETPVIALENVQFARRSIADATVEAQIRLALYLGQTS